MFFIYEECFNFKTYRNKALEDMTFYWSSIYCFNIFLFCTYGYHVCLLCCIITRSYDSRKECSHFISHCTLSTLFFLGEYMNECTLVTLLVSVPRCWTSAPFLLLLILSYTDSFHSHWIFSWVVDPDSGHMTIF